MNGITEERLNRLQTAIERARLPGRALYVEGGQPACVIAQLGVLEGIPIERIATWKGSVVSLRRTAVELQVYPRYLLDHLQLAWDDPFRDAEQARANMRHRLRRWMGGERGSSWDRW